MTSVGTGPSSAETVLAFLQLAACLVLPLLFLALGVSEWWSTRGR